MKFKDLLKSPVFPAGHRWKIEKRDKLYESDVTALVRGMLEDESIQADQRFAWERWRAEDRVTRTTQPNPVLPLEGRGEGGAGRDNRA